MLTPKRAGYGVLVGPGYTKEYDTCTCKHCNKAWVVRSNDPNNKGDPGGWCRMCNAPICPECAGKECKPFLVKLDEIEAKDRLTRELENAK